MRAFIVPKEAECTLWPLSIANLLNMLIFDAADSLAASAYLVGAASDWKVQAQLIAAGHLQPLILSTQQKAHFLDSLRRIEETALKLDMHAARAAADRGFEECLAIFDNRAALGAYDLHRVISHGEHTALAFTDEMRHRLVFTLLTESAKYYERACLFGEKVEDAFPSASADIAEAGKCRALARYTASVMHLMRVLEVGLGALAAHCGLTPSENWNSTLNQIEASLRQVSRKRDGVDAEQWAAEAGTHIRFIKNAWRNHAMHPRERYDENDAAAIFDNARSLMQHLAERLSE